MKIIKFTKLKNSMYKLTLEDKTALRVHEDLILKEKLLITKEIDNEMIENIDSLNNNLSAYDIAIKYISNRLRSKYEVEEFLKKKEINIDLINEIIDKLKKQNYLNDDLYAKSFILDQINLTNNGPYKIKKELEEKRVSSNYIEKYINMFDSNLEKDKLNKLIPKYLNSLKGKSYYMIKNKILNHFSELGYSKNIIISLIENIEYDDKDNYKKEYDKLYKKYSRKYDGEELEFKIRQSLYQKGFRQ